MQQIASNNNNSLASKAGLPMSLIWGYAGILIFMRGDGMEAGWLRAYLTSRGMTIEQSATLYTAYGVTIAISAWFSGVLAEGYGPKKTMLAGLLLYLAGTVGFVGYGIPHLN